MIELYKLYPLFAEVFGDNMGLFLDLHDIFEGDNHILSKFIEKKRFEKACDKSKTAGDMARLLNPNL